MIDLRRMIGLAATREANDARAPRTSQTIASWPLGLRMNADRKWKATKAEMEPRINAKNWAAAFFIESLTFTS